MYHKIRCIFIYNVNNFRFLCIHFCIHCVSIYMTCRKLNRNNDRHIWMIFFKGLLRYFLIQNHIWIQDCYQWCERNQVFNSKKYIESVYWEWQFKQTLSDRKRMEINILGPRGCAFGWFHCINSHITSLLWNTF